MVWWSESVEKGSNEDGRVGGSNLVVMVRAKGGGVERGFWRWSGAEMYDLGGLYACR